jgi:hypothetical protein
MTGTTEITIAADMRGFYLPGDWVRVRANRGERSVIVAMTATTITVRPWRWTDLLRRMFGWLWQ